MGVLPPLLSTTKSKTTNPLLHTFQGLTPELWFVINWALFLRKRRMFSGNTKPVFAGTNLEAEAQGKWGRLGRAAGPLAGSGTL